MRVLVAEDERITRTSLVRQIEGWGHSVVAAEDGEAAWEQFQSAEFDIVITDWEMPRLSGVDLIQRIRKVAGTKYVYVIMLTGRNDKSDIVSGIEAGADDFVSKPFDREELRVRLLAGQRVVHLERELSRQNIELRTASERMREDLRAAARVQRAMLPKAGINTARANTWFVYVSTDELAGDALGFHIIDDRYLVTYVVDVTGHGVPAALLAVTVMHALSPTGEGATLLRRSSKDEHRVQRPAIVISELNRRFTAADNDGRFLTMVLCILDTHTGRLTFARAGHPLPIIVRGNAIVPLDDAGGFPLGVANDAEYEDVCLQLAPGDRMLLYSDGMIEQRNAETDAEFGIPRLESLMLDHAQMPGEQCVLSAVSELEKWAGAKCFADDVSLVLTDWRGPSESGS